MTTPEERRKHPRKSYDDLWIDVEIIEDPILTRSVVPKQIKVRVDNLSESGICIISDDPFEIGQTIRFASTEVKGKGTVVWTSSQPKAQAQAGIQFDK